MSIVPMRRATVVGPRGERDAMLDELQTLGCLHVVPLGDRRTGPCPDGGEGPVRAALRILGSLRSRRRTARHLDHVDPEAIAHRVVHLQESIEAATFARDHLQQRIHHFRPWGDFTFPPLEELAQIRLWFYRVPHYRVRQIPEEAGPWQIVGRSARHAYVVVLGETEPAGMPVPRVHLGAKPLSQLERELEAVELELEDLSAERDALTRYRRVLARHHARTRDAATRDQVATLGLDDPDLFALQGWVPGPRATELSDVAVAHGWAVQLEAPGPDDEPPVLLDNPEPVAGGQLVVSFYSLPGYRTVDPSIPLFFALSVFFGMILSDAGYAMLLGLVLAMAWRPLQRTRDGQRLARLGLGIVVASVVYGVAVGSWFGTLPAPFAGLQLLDVTDNTSMMSLSVAIGWGHILLANLLAAWSLRGQPRMLAPLGWVLVLGAVAWGTAAWAGAAPAIPAIGLAVLGALGVVGFTGRGRLATASDYGRQLFEGLVGLAGITRMFGDVLSYLRLFALGLASASLAVTFNQLAADVLEATPGIGIALAGLILLLGHGINLTLGVLGGVVHGLRLNVLEFQGWCVPEEGRPFRALARTEETTWNRS